MQMMVASQSQPTKFKDFYKGVESERQLDTHGLFHKRGFNTNQAQEIFFSVSHEF